MWGVLAKISNWISGSNSDHHSSESDRGLTNELKRNMLSVSLPLPEDLVITILSFVPANDLLQNCIYVKEWVHLINSQSLWITKCTNEGIPLPLVKPDPLPENFYRAIYFVPYGANLLKNSCGKDGLNHWAVAGYNDYELSNDDGEGSSHGWTIEDPPAGSDPLPNSDCQSCFSTTYTWCRKRQVVNLLEAVGSYSEVLDIVKPTIEVSEWYAARFDCGSTYRLSVLLLDQHENVIDKFEFSHTEPQWTGKRWEKSTLKINQQSLPEFWSLLKRKYPEVEKRALDVLIPFVTSYLCEVGFSAMAVIKTKYQSLINVEKDMRIEISKLVPCFELLMAKKQPHPSH